RPARVSAMPRADAGVNCNADATRSGIATPAMPDNINAALLKRPRFIDSVWRVHADGCRASAKRGNADHLTRLRQRKADLGASAVASPREHVRQPRARW